MRIAVVDPDPSEQALVRQLLEKSGFEVALYAGVDAVDATQPIAHFDAIVLAWRPADAPTLSRIRLREPRMPILLMLAGVREDDIIEGLSSGADDYLVKPIRTSELIARLQALLRRAYPDGALDRFVFEPFTFLPEPCEVAVATSSGDRRVALTQKEFDLGLLLFRSAGRPLSRNHLRESVWGGEANVSSRTMDTHVSRLRSKLELGAAGGYRIMPVYGYGYRLDRLAA